MKLAAAQVASVRGDLVANVRRHVEYVERAAALAADLPRIAMVVYRPFTPTVVHAKRRLHADELAWFSPGDEPTVFELGGRRLAPAICFEAVQREHVDAVVALGATTYLASVAKHARGVGQAHETLAAVAREHRMTVVLSNAVGAFADGVAGGRSAAWHPDGTLAASLDEASEGLVCVDTEDDAIRACS